MDIEAAFVGVKKENRRIKRKDALGNKVDDIETIYTTKFAMKKARYDKDENIKEGTDDPWTTVSISSFSETTFDEFIDKKMGTPVVISIQIVEEGE